ncbi:low molecular weight phosphotyrosine protein phosphatase [Vibrio sp. SCSIO 43136]|uniref:arsenate reductase/protein-tyrosine-phosphatase family protein n=1 Tax=Vibrio sp. SCSIO 43136 TaxID=2819101 RepID=UPI002075B1D9|nr:low molecular weight phosphotyrosine protein phosphatase [Vibrio sp. SCSIO 43136]USD67029.1 low molecular weight phosphotyrosine protein phosphatase [Vibrio sp. SCSIO 43136]
MFNSILIICTANICRSPLAEAIFKRHLPNKQIGSAGTQVSSLGIAGAKADQGSINVAETKGLDLSSHTSQPLTAELAKGYDLILVMTEQHRQEVMEIAPGSGGRTLFIGQWIGQGHIDDPYKQSDDAFDACYEVLERAAVSWAARLGSTAKKFN